MTLSRLTQITDRARRAWRSRTETVPRVLVADDDEDVRVFCSAALKREGYEVDVAADGRQAVEMLRGRSYATILLDLGMPYLHGATVVAILAKTQPEALSRLIVITGASDAALGELRGARVILKKPFAVGRLLDAVQECQNGKRTSDTQTRPR
jgi:DNA-binding response OmpR family regulator